MSRRQPLSGGIGGEHTAITMASEWPDRVKRTRTVIDQAIFFLGGPGEEPKVMVRRDDYKLKKELDEARKVRRGAGRKKGKKKEKKDEEEASGNV